MMSTYKPGTDVVDSVEDARLQAIEYLGFMKPKRIRAGDKVYEIPNPSMLDRSQRRRYAELQLSLEQLDRWPDIKNDAGEVIALGDPKTPHRKDGELLDDYDVRLTNALLGDDAAQEYFDNGGLPGDVALFWTEMNQRVADRRRDDSKSAGSTEGLAPVPDADSV